MRNVPLPTWIVLLSRLAFASLLAAIPARAAGSDHAADVRTIRDIVERHRAAMEHKDVEAAIAFYAPDAIVMPAGHPAARGTDAIRAFFASILKSPKIEVVFTSQKLDFSSAGDLAIEVGARRLPDLRSRRGLRRAISVEIYRGVAKDRRNLAGGL